MGAYEKDGRSRKKFSGSVTGKMLVGRIGISVLSGKGSGVRVSSPPTEASRGPHSRVPVAAPPSLNGLAPKSYFEPMLNS